MRWCNVARAIGLLVMLHTIKGQSSATTTQSPSATTGMTFSTTASQPSTNGTQGVTNGTGAPTSTTAAAATTAAVSTSTTPTQTTGFPATPTMQTLNSTGVSTSGSGNISSCAAEPLLCCFGEDRTCRRQVCFCDVGCLRRKDCCSDFASTCLTGIANATNNVINTTLVNATAFHLFSFAGNCSAGIPMCCQGKNASCYRGCFCDESCLNNNDCCPDFEDTCRVNTTSINATITPPELQSLILGFAVSLLVPSNSNSTSLEAHLKQLLLLVEHHLKVTFGIDSIRILKIQKV